MTAATFAPNEAQQIRDACHLGRSCAACGHPGAGSNPLVLVADGYRIHVSHVLDPDDGFYGMEFDEYRTPAEIAADALLADCGYGGCWAESSVLCNAGDGAIHLARFGRAERRGLISAADLAVILAVAGADAVPGTAIPADVIAGVA